MIDPNVTGIPYAPRKIPITDSFASQLPNDGAKTWVRYLRGVERIAPPTLAFSHIFFTQRQKIRNTRTTRNAAAASMAIVKTRWSPNQPQSGEFDPRTGMS